MSRQKNLSMTGSFGRRASLGRPGDARVRLSIETHPVLSLT